VPWDQALDIVMQNNSLDKTAKRQRSAHRDALHSKNEKPEKAQRDLEKAQAEAIASSDRPPRVLSYAKGGFDGRRRLEEFLSSRGDILLIDSFEPDSLFAIFPFGHSGH